MPTDYGKFAEEYEDPQLKKFRKAPPPPPGPRRAEPQGPGMLATALKKLNEAGMAIPAAVGPALSSATFGGSDWAARKINPEEAARQQRIRAEHPVASTIGTVAGYAAPGGAISGGIRAGARAVPALGRASGLLAGNTVPGVVAREGLAGAGLSSAIDVSKGEMPDPKRAALSGLVGGTLGGGIAAGLRTLPGGAIRASAPGITAAEREAGLDFAGRSAERGIPLTAPEALAAVAPETATGPIGAYRRATAFPQGAQEAMAFEAGRDPLVRAAGERLAKEVSTTGISLEQARAAATQAGEATFKSKTGKPLSGAALRAAEDRFKKGPLGALATAKKSTQQGRALFGAAGPAEEKAAQRAIEILPPGIPPAILRNFIESEVSKVGPTKSASFGQKVFPTEESIRLAERAIAPRGAPPAGNIPPVAPRSTPPPIVPAAPVGGPPAAPIPPVPAVPPIPVPPPNIPAPAAVQPAPAAVSRPRVTPGTTLSMGGIIPFYPGGVRGLFGPLPPKQGPKLPEIKFDKPDPYRLPESMSPEDWMKEGLSKKEATLLATDMGWRDPAGKIAPIVGNKYVEPPAPKPRPEPRLRIGVPERPPVGQVGNVVSIGKPPGTTLAAMGLPFYPGGAKKLFGPLPPRQAPLAAPVGPVRSPIRETIEAARAVTPQRTTPAPPSFWGGVQGIRTGRVAKLMQDPKWIKKMGLQSPLEKMGVSVTTGLSATQAEKLAPLIVGILAKRLITDEKSQDWRSTNQTPIMERLIEQ